MTAAAKPVHASLSAALVAAQADMPAVEADAHNPHFKSRFVSLGNLVAKVRPVLNRHDLAVAQFPSMDDTGKPTLVTVIIHGGTGERLEYAAPLLPTKADPQGLGSAITYMRRYALAAALGIVDQEDDDGEAASRNGAAAAPLLADPVLTPVQASKVIAAFTTAGVEGEALAPFLTAAGIVDQTIITVPQARVLRGLLDEHVAADEPSPAGVTA